MYGAHLLLGVCISSHADFQETIGKLFEWNCTWSILKVKRRALSLLHIQHLHLSAKIEVLQSHKSRKGKNLCPARWRILLGPADCRYVCSPAMCLQLKRDLSDSNKASISARNFLNVQTLKIFDTGVSGHSDFPHKARIPSERCLSWAE